MKKFFSTFFVVFSLCLVLFLIFFVKIVPEYNSDILENIITKNDNNSFEFLASEKQNSWYLGFDKNILSQYFPDTDNFCVQFSVNNSFYNECLDTEHEDETGNYYTFPIVTSPTDTIAFEIFYQ